MADFLLTMNLDDEDATVRGGEAVADHLRYVADLAEQGFTSGQINDPNGFHIGHWQVT